MTSKGGSLLPNYESNITLSIVRDVKAAIADGVHPKMISKGSSGSYFARAKVGGRVQTVA